MISRKRLAAAGIATIVLPIGLILAADRVGVDVGLVANQFVKAILSTAGKGANEPEHAGAASRDLDDHASTAPITPGKKPHGREMAADGPSHAAAEPEHGQRAADHDAVERDGKNGEEADHASPTDPPAPFDRRYHVLPDGEDQPWNLVRNLQRLQDLIVQGKAGALEAYRAALAATSQDLLLRPRAEWHHPRNVMAAASFVMSGGSPSIARRLADDPALQGTSGQLLRAALAFATGDYYRAYNQMYDIDPAQLPASMAGQVALVRAMLTSPRNLPEANRFLHLARTLAPGTLTEEAAIRRQIKVHTELDEYDAFFGDAQSYMRRFPHSHYIADFLRNYATGILKLAEDGDPSVIAGFEKIRSMIDADAGLYLFTLLARGATVFGKHDIARVAARNSMELAMPGSRLAERLKLYHAAASLSIIGEVPQTFAALGEIDPDKLGTEDRRLLAAARLVADQIMQPFAPSMFLDEVPAENADAPPANMVQVEGAGEVEMVLSKAERVLKNADELIGW